MSDLYNATRLPSGVNDDADDDKVIDLPKTEFVTDAPKPIVATGVDMRSDNIAFRRRQLKAMELRMQGGSFRAIAETMIVDGDAGDGYDSARAYRDVKMALNELMEKHHETADELRQLMHEQLNDILLAYYDRATTRGDYFAVDRVFGALDRIANLYGLYKANNPLDNMLRDFDMSKLTTEQLEQVAVGVPLIKVILDGPIAAAVATPSLSGTGAPQTDGQLTGHADAGSEPSGSVHP